MLSIVGRSIGLVAGAVTALLWITIIWFPVGGFMLEGVSVVVGGFMALFGLVAAIASFNGHAPIVFVCFVASFFGVGSFVLNVEGHWIRVFGLLDLLLLIASVLIWYSARRGETEK